MNNRRVFVSDEEVTAIGRGLFDRTLPKGEWTHAAHFAAALWVLACRPDLEASVALPLAIRAYNEATGVHNTGNSGYHDTITQASIRAARAFIATCGCDSLFTTCNALLASPLGNSSWLLDYWSRSCLLSTEARRGWLEPDVAPFPY
jgi:hypothetical protein